MRKYTEIIIVIAFAIFVVVMFMLNNHPKEHTETVTKTTQVTSSITKVKTPQEIEQRKSEILKEINEINKQLASTTDQEMIDQLAKQKKALQEEYLTLDS